MATKGQKQIFRTENEKYEDYKENYPKKKLAAKTTIKSKRR